MKEHKEEKTEEHHEHLEHSQKVPEVTEKIRKNPWILATSILAVVLVVLLIINLTSGISKDEAAKKLLNFYTGQGISGLTLNNTEKVSGVYKVTFNYQGQPVPLYITTDGKMIGSLEKFQSTTSDTTTETNTQEIPKSDKPKVNLYVFSYCPYGLQAEKGFVPVYNLMKNVAEMDIKFIGAMHGQYEETESLRQLCIKKNYGTDKFMEYINKFAIDTAIGACSSSETCSKPLVEKLMTSLSINVNTINTCMTKDAQTLYEADQASASQLEISGSPTFTINGVQAQVGRDSASIQQAVCAAFNTAPSQCSQTLSSASPSAGFGGSTGTATGASC